MKTLEQRNGFGNTRSIPKTTTECPLRTDIDNTQSGSGGFDRQADSFKRKMWEEDKGDVKNIYEYLYPKDRVDDFNTRLFDCLAESLQINQVLKVGTVDRAGQYHDNQEEYENAFDIRTADYKLDDGLKIRFSLDEEYREATTLENPINIKCDYLRVRFKFVSIDRLYELLNYALTEDHWVISEGVTYSLGRGVPTMGNKIEGVLNVIGGFNVNCIDENTQELEYDILIDFKGEFLRTKTIVEQWLFMRGLKFAFGARATRFDIALDDYSYKLIPLKQMVQAFNAGDNWHFRSYGIQFVKKSKDAPVVPTHYFGSRESQSLVRVYNHDLDCMRFELETKRDKAVYLFNFFTGLERCKGLWNDWKKIVEFDDRYSDYKGCDLTELYKIEIGDNKFNDWDPIKNVMNIDVDKFGEDYLTNEEWDSELQKMLGSYAVGSIDFRSKDFVVNVEKASKRDCLRWDWWQNFINLIGIDYKPSIPKPKKDLMKVVKWLHKQVMPSLAMIKKGLGDNEFFEWLIKYLMVADENRLTEWQNNQAKFISKYPKYILGH